MKHVPVFLGSLPSWNCLCRADFPCLIVVFYSKIYIFNHLLYTCFCIISYVEKHSLHYAGSK